MAVTARHHNETTLGSLEEGDMVEFRRGLYSHYGVYVGDGDVVHLAGEDESDGLGDVNSSHLFTICGNQFNKAWVKKDNFWEVVGSDKAYIANKDKQRNPLPKHEVVANALSKIGRVGYNLIYKNCEHFANWCRYEVEKSDQVDGYFTAAAVGAAVVGVLGVVAMLTGGEKKKEKQLQ